MKNSRWKKLSTEQLLEEIRIRSAKRGRCIREGPVREANRQFDILMALDQELRERGMEARRQLLKLLEDPEPATRCWVAIKVLGFAPEAAERVLVELSNSQKDATGVEAQFSLDRWRAGEFRPT